VTGRKEGGQMLKQEIVGQTEGQVGRHLVMRFYYLFVTNQHFFFPDVLLEQLTVGRGEFSCLLQVPEEAFSSHTLFGANFKFWRQNLNFSAKFKF
jgi:hypothetical protein